MRTILAGLLLCAIATVSGCSDGGLTTPAVDSPSARPTPSVAGSPSAEATRVGGSRPARAAKSYDTAQRLAGAVNEAGFPCVHWRQWDDPFGAVERGSCHVGTEPVVAAIYASAAEAGREPMRARELMSGISDVNVVSGGNWTLSCESRQLCARFDATFGGFLLHLPK